MVVYPTHRAFKLKNIDFSEIAHNRLSLSLLRWNFFQQLDTSVFC
jgi:hypothetical protein